MNRRLNGIGVALALVIFAACIACWAALSGCQAFVGPYTQEYPCPVSCGRSEVDGHQICCNAQQECSTGKPKVCIPAFPAGASTDAGAD